VTQQGPDCEPDLGQYRTLVAVPIRSRCILQRELGAIMSDFRRLGIWGRCVSHYMSNNLAVV
jgi:hypothetical protein